MNLASKNLGAVYGAMGRMEDAIRLSRQALESNAKDAEALNNLALLYRDQCDVDACLEHLSACLQLEPENVHAGSNRLMTLNYKSESSHEEVFEEHRAWGERLETKIAPQFSSWGAAPTPSSSCGTPLLRVGYISPDFYAHSVSYFIHAALRHHDLANVHVTCYSDVAIEDEKTQMFRGFV